MSYRGLILFGESETGLRLRISTHVASVRHYKIRVPPRAPPVRIVTKVQPR